MIGKVVCILTISSLLLALVIFVNMPVGDWEDELMFYVEGSYLDAFYEDITSTFGIVSTEEHILDDKFYPYRFP